MVSIETQSFRSCEVLTISGTIVDVKMTMQCIIKKRKNVICIRKNHTDKAGFAILEIPKR